MTNPKNSQPTLSNKSYMEVKEK